MRLGLIRSTLARLLLVLGTTSACVSFSPADVNFELEGRWTVQEVSPRDFGFMPEVLVLSPLGELSFRTSTGYLELEGEWQRISDDSFRLTFQGLEYSCGLNVLDRNIARIHCLINSDDGFRDLLFEIKRLTGDQFSE
jgi:hypothetical protein